MNVPAIAEKPTRSVAACVVALAMLAGGGRIFDAAVLMAAAAPSSPISPGLVGLAAGAPFLLAGTIGRLLTATGLTRTSAVLLGTGLSALAGTASAIGLGGDDRYLLVYGALALVTMSETIVNATWMSALPDALPDDTHRRRTIGLTATATAATAATGPMVAALLLGAIDAAGLCLVYAATATTSGAAMAIAINAFGTGTKTEAGATERPRSTTRFAGLRAIAAERRVRSPVLVQVVTNLIVFGVIYSLPVRAAEYGWAPERVAVGMSVLLAGTLAGSLLATALTGARLYRAVLVIEPMVRAIALLGFVFATDLWSSSAFLFLFAFPQGFGRVARQSMMTEAFGAGVRLQVMATYRGLLGLATAIAPLIMEGSVGLAGIRGYTIACVAILIVLFALQVADTSKEKDYECRSQRNRT